MTVFYWAAIESILSYCISMRYESCSVADKKNPCSRWWKLQRNGCSLPLLTDIAAAQRLEKKLNKTKQNKENQKNIKKTLPTLVITSELLPSCRRYRGIRTCTSRFRESFFSPGLPGLFILSWQISCHDAAVLSLTLWLISTVYYTSLVVWLCWLLFYCPVSGGCVMVPQRSYPNSVVCTADNDN